MRSAGASSARAHAICTEGRGWSPGRGHVSASPLTGYPAPSTRPLRKGVAVHGHVDGVGGHVLPSREGNMCTNYLECFLMGHLSLLPIYLSDRHIRGDPWVSTSHAGLCSGTSVFLSLLFQLWPVTALRCLPGPSDLPTFVFLSLNTSYVSGTCHLPGRSSHFSKEIWCFLLDDDIGNEQLGTR